MAYEIVSHKFWFCGATFSLAGNDHITGLPRYSVNDKMVCNRGIGDLLPTAFPIWARIEALFRRAVGILINTRFLLGTWAGIRLECFVAHFSQSYSYTHNVTTRGAGCVGMMLDIPKD